MTPPTDAAVLGGITAESKEYFEKRSLKKGAVNWVLLMSLGIAYVISGDFSRMELRHRLRWLVRNAYRILGHGSHVFVHGTRLG